jgi:hypothetical protein
MRLTGKAGFEKTDTLHTRSCCVYRYFSEITIYAALFMDSAP